MEYDVVLAHDFSGKDSFSKYLVNLQEYVDSLESKDKYHIVVRPTHGCLTGNIRYAIENIDPNSDYILIVQHDLPFIRSFNVQTIIDDMENDSDLKHIRFNKRKNIRDGYDAFSSIFGKEVKGKHHSYVLTPGWSDNNHLCKTSYYTDFVLKICKDGSFPEEILHGHSKTENDHKLYGTYLFDKLDSLPCIKHTDGKYTM